MKAASTDSKYLIRPAAAEDLIGIQSLLTSVMLPVEGVEKHLADFLILSQEGKFIGTVGLEIYGDKALLRSLAITPQEHGNGYGIQLYQAIIRKAQERGISEIYLLTETAEKFFTARGFEKISRDVVDERVKASVEFQSACPASAACMRMKLRHDV